MTARLPLRHGDSNWSVHFGRWRLLGVALLFWLAISNPLVAQEAAAKSTWIGVRVMPKMGVKRKVDGREIRGGSLPWVIQAVNGPWFWVGADEKGWVHWRDVVTLEDAPAYFSRVIRDDEKKRDIAYVQRAIVWKHLGELSLAIDDYTAAIRLDPDDPTAYNNRGAVWEAQQDYDQAILDYNQAIRLDASAPRYFNNRGSAWRKKKEYDKALLDFGRALQLDPRYSLAYHFRALLWIEKGEYARAEADIRASLRIDPNDAAAYGTWARIALNQKQYAVALEKYAQARRLNPREPSYYNDAAWLLATCPDPAIRDGRLAVELATEARRHDKKAYWGYLDTLACAYAEAGDFASACRWAEQAVAGAPADAKPLAERRLALYRSGRPYREDPATGEEYVESSAPAAPGVGRKYALLIGIDKYPAGSLLSSLRFPERDVEALAGVLREAGFAASDIRVLTRSRGADDVTFLPIARNIRREIDALLADKQPEDTLLLALAGHGVLMPIDRPSNGPPREETVFCPIDADLRNKSADGLISLDELFDRLAKSPARLKCVFCDACRNDAFAGARPGGVELPPPVKPPSSVAALFSCAREEVAFEDDALAGGHGVFFHFVISGLQGAADLNGDKQITLAELSEFVQERVRAHVARRFGSRQMPELQGAMHRAPLRELR